jgi:hypothetical protein
MQAMVERANTKFNRENIGEFNAEWLAPGVPLAQGAQQAGIAVTNAEVQYLESLPAGHQEALRASLYSAVTRGLPVTLAWAPAFDFSVGVWEVAGTGQSMGGMTLFVRGPYQKPNAA